jgi:hypothetical protein
MKHTTDTGTSDQYSIRDIVGVIGDAQTYKNLLYLLLAFPLGITYYVLLIVGFSLGLGLSILVVGLGILVGTAIGLRLIAKFERTLANTLLDTDISDPDDVEDADGIVGTCQAYLKASSTWRGLGFIFLKFWFGILSFVLLVTFLGTAVELLLVPIFPEGALNIQISGWKVAQSIDTTAQRLLALPCGAILAFVAIHILNAFARVNASLASSMLGPKTAARVEQAN